MNTIQQILSIYAGSFGNEGISTAVIAAVILATLVLSLYMFLVYRLVSHKSLYNRAFNVCVTVLPLFIATIILSLQSNLVITLGTIGALAIIRFRTAVKDPVDMLYILWAVHIGITCGCQLYELALLTAVVVTAVLLVLNRIHLGKAPFVVVFQCDAGKEQAVMDLIRAHATRVRVKSRNFTAKGMNITAELGIRDAAALSAALAASELVSRFSMIEYDNDDVL